MVLRRGSLHGPFLPQRLANGDDELLEEHLLVLGNQGVGKNRIIDRLQDTLHKQNRLQPNMHLSGVLNRSVFERSLNLKKPGKNSRFWTKVLPIFIKAFRYTFSPYRDTSLEDLGLITFGRDALLLVSIDVTIGSVVLDTTIAITNPTSLLILLFTLIALSAHQSLLPDLRTLQTDTRTMSANHLLLVVAVHPFLHRSSTSRTCSSPPDNLYPHVLPEHTWGMSLEDLSLTLGKDALPLVSINMTIGSVVLDAAIAMINPTSPLVLLFTLIALSICQSLPPRSAHPSSSKPSFRHSRPPSPPSVPAAEHAARRYDTDDMMTL
ncbi:hypothetical protein K435DRAFT_33439 [Dendrothele bispora CBS 962.96]|uniref:Uncharacterized protein n=1 Tax=Dendrothele bispora (strain CBS 962.96) TaxID=1314807 RepID=A0A4S8M7I3_DENBC|nr:hypothetical protein K435DRAFT_33439 [Dendrothele bispora CBS 962.96]